MVGALTMCLGFGACAHTYKISKATGYEETFWGTTWDGPGRGGGCQEWWPTSWMCGDGSLTPIFKKEPTRNLEITSIDYKVTTSGYPGLCWVGEQFESESVLGIWGYARASNGTERGETLFIHDGRIEPEYSKSLPVNYELHNSTNIVSYVPLHVSCPFDYGEFTATVVTEMTLRSEHFKPRIHRRTVTAIYKPVVPDLRVKLIPDTIKLDGPVGTYIEAKTRVSVDSDVPVSLDVQWPAVDMVEYEIWEGKWADRKGDAIEVKDGNGYRDQKIRLRSSTPLSTMISIPVKVTVK